jgi:hypothetical protein
MTSRQASYDAGVTRPLLEACVAICKSRGDECERHAQTTQLTRTVPKRRDITTRS